MDNTILQQGKFTSDGTTKTLAIRSDVDWMIVYNYTNVAGTGDDGVKFYWQRGMGDGGVIYYKDGAGHNLLMDVLAAADGFRLTDTSIITASRLPNPVTDITNAFPPVVTSNAHGLMDGDIVRLSDCVGAQQLGTIDFTVSEVNANEFTLDHMAAIVAAAAPGVNAYAYKISADLQFYPPHRYISDVTQAVNGVVTVTVIHDYKVGQKVRFSVPNVTAAAYGMIELGGQTATITDVIPGNNTFEVDIDTRAYSAFAFPLTADAPFIPAIVTPIGQDTGYSIAAGADILSGAVRNRTYIGMKLPAGENAPGGAANDVMYWVAGKSFSVTNE